MLRLNVHRPHVSRSAAVLVLLVLTMFWSRSAQAVEGGISPYLKGSAGFMSGFIPPQPGLFILNKIFYRFDGSVDASVRNGRAEFGANVDLNVGLLQGVYVTGAHLFGGTYAFGGIVDYAWVDLDASIAGPAGGTVGISESADGIADSIIVPIIVGWHDGNLHMNASLPIYIPTGSYDSKELSVGKNIWAFMPTFSVTWFDMANGWDVSGSFVLVFPTNNNDTDYQSGILFHLDWAVGKHLGKWEIGVAGNIVQQITGDSGSGAVLGDLRAESIGIGPAINFSTMIGRAPLTIGAKWQHDIDASRTFKGDVINLSLTLVL